MILNIPEDATSEQIAAAQDFVRERTSSRYNKQANALLAGWVRLLVGPEPTRVINGFGISDGLDPSFEISSVTAFSGVFR